MKNDVSSFFYYMWNKWSEDECKIVFADSCGGYKHYWNKWVYFCNEYGVRAAVDMLYGELDKMIPYMFDQTCLKQEDFEEVKD